jgi:hypothetical protein
LVSILQIKKYEGNIKNYVFLKQHESWGKNKENPSLKLYLKAKLKKNFNLKKFTKFL